MKNTKVSEDQKGKVNKTGDCEKLIQELDIVKAQTEEFKSKYLRALADYQNLEKRISHQQEEIITLANSRLIIKLLPLVDTLDKAEIFVKDQGLKTVKDGLIKILTESGLEELNILNKEYDPYTAEVVDMVKGEKDNLVVEVVRKGYQLNGKIIRIAQVKVSKTVIS